MSSTRSIRCSRACSRIAAVGAVVVPEDFGMLQEFAPREHGLELLAGDEMVILPVDFRAPGLPGRVRHGKHEPGT